MKLPRRLIENNGGRLKSKTINRILNRFYRTSKYWMKRIREYWIKRIREYSIKRIREYQMKT